MPKIAQSKPYYKNRIFYEDFTSVKTVADHGGVFTGSPVVDKGANFAEGEHIKYSNKINPLSDGQEISFGVKFTVDDLSVGRALLQFGDGTTAHSGSIIILNTGKIRSYWNDTWQNGGSADLIEAGKTYEIIVTAVVGSNISGVYVNTVTPQAGGVNALAGTTDSDITIGDVSDETLPFDGIIHKMFIYNKLFSQEEVNDHYEEDTYSELNSCNWDIDLPLSSRYDNGSAIVTKNLGKGSETVQLGDGSTTNTMPLQSSPRGFLFDGTNDYLESDIDTSGYTYLTVEATVTRLDLDSFQTIAGAANSGSWTNGWGLGMDASQNLIFWIDAYSSAASTPAPLINQLYHVVGVYDGTNQKIYVNGELKSTVADVWTNKTSAPIYIGAQHSGPTTPLYFWRGDMKHRIRIGDFAATDTQVKALYFEAMNKLNI